MARFEKVKRFENVDFNLPVRKTKHSAGYDFEVAEDIIIPPYNNLRIALDNELSRNNKKYFPLLDTARMTKDANARPSLVSTGVKCYLNDDEYLELSMRSSSPLKYWLVLANSVGIIDADYADNIDNEGEIFFQVINFGPTGIYLKKGDIIGQGIIHKYSITEDDNPIEEQRQGGFGSTTKKEG